MVEGKFIFTMPEKILRQLFELKQQTDNIYGLRKQAKDNYSNEKR